MKKHFNPYGHVCIWTWTLQKYHYYVQNFIHLVHRLQKSCRYLQCSVLITGYWIVYSSDHLIATAKVMHQKQKLLKQLSIMLSVHKLQMHNFRGPLQSSSRRILTQHSNCHRNYWNYQQAFVKQKSWACGIVDTSKYKHLVDNTT
jgi:hypothetical protein